MKFHTLTSSGAECPLRRHRVAWSNLLRPRISTRCVINARRALGPGSDQPSSPSSCSRFALHHSLLFLFFLVQPAVMTIFHITKVAPQTLCNTVPCIAVDGGHSDGRSHTAFGGVGGHFGQEIDFSTTHRRRRRFLCVQIPNQPSLISSSLFFFLFSQN